MANLPEGNDFVVIAGPGVVGAPFPTLVSWVSEAAATGTDRRRR